jgi:hypothetical protein
MVKRKRHIVMLTYMSCLYSFYAYIIVTQCLYLSLGVFVKHFERSTRMYRGADKPLARPTSRCILFDGENISFDASLVIYINNTNIPPIMIINRIYETQNLLSL